MSQQAKKQAFIFNIQVKANGEKLNIPVYESDNHQSLVSRLCQNGYIKSEYQAHIKDKIIHQLLNKIKAGEIKQKLKDKVSKFVTRQNESQKLLNDSKTPYKMLKNSSKSKVLHQQVSHKQVSPQNRHRNSMCQAKKIITKKHYKPISNVASIKSKETKNIDSDLTLAYKTILNKCRDPNMKNMARKYLQEANIIIGKPVQNELFLQGKHEITHKVSQFKQNELQQYPTLYQQQVKKPQKNSYLYVKNGNGINSVMNKFNYQRQQSPQNLLLRNVYDYESRSCERTQMLLDYNLGIKQQYQKFPIRNRSSTNMRRTRKYKYAID